MKVLIFAYQFPPAKGGVPFSNLEIAQGLHNLGHSVMLVASRNRESADFISNLNFSVRLLPKWLFTPMPSLGPQGWPNWIFVPLYFLLIRYHLQWFKPDAILVADETSNAFWGTWASLVRIPYISYCSVPQLNFIDTNRHISIRGKIGRKIRLLLRKFLVTSYINSKLILAVSSSTKKELGQATPELLSKMSIVPRSIDDSFYTSSFDQKITSQLKIKFEISQNNFVLLTISRLIIEKGIDDVLKSMSTLNSSILSNIRYIIVGEGDAQGQLKELATSLGLNNNVTFAGGIEHHKLIPYYDICDAFILPSRTGVFESFGRVFVEAASRSKPSIAVNEGGMVDVIDNGKTGFLVKAGDKDAICKNLLFMMSNPKMVQSMGERAKRKARRLYSSDVVALQIEKSLKSVVK